MIMSIYDYRDRPAYREIQIAADYCENKYILKWWKQEHDKLIEELINREQWGWCWFITEEVKELTSRNILESWRLNDPLCSRYAWYNIIMYFAIARAKKLDLLKNIRKPEWRTCPFCGFEFIEDSLPQPLIDRVGINQIDFCSICLTKTVLFSGKMNVDKDDIIQYLTKITDVIQKIPNQDFGAGKNDISELNTNERLVILKLLENKPAIRIIKKIYGSWLNALKEANILPDGTRRTSRGTQCIAKDGHLCYSLAEKTIDDYLFRNGIKHDKEPKYPEGNFRADFQVGEFFLEYFGLKGDPQYDERTELKIEICNKHKIKIIAIYNEDLVEFQKLKDKIRILIGDQVT
jgi:hypothetical protein